MEQITIYYAVNYSGQGCIFEDKPERCTEGFKVWKGTMTSYLTLFIGYMESRGLELPKITWDDDPVKITISFNLYGK